MLAVLVWLESSPKSRIECLYSQMTSFSPVQSLEYKSEFINNFLDSKHHEIVIEWKK